MLRTPYGVQGILAHHHAQQEFRSRHPRVLYSVQFGVIGTLDFVGEVEHTGEGQRWNMREGM